MFKRYSILTATVLIAVSAAFPALAQSAASGMSSHSVMRHHHAATGKHPMGHGSMGHGSMGHGSMGHGSMGHRMRHDNMMHKRKTSGAMEHAGRSAGR